MSIFPRLLLIILSILFANCSWAQSSSLSGIIIDEKTKEAVIFGYISLYQKGNLISVAETDSIGFYHLDTLQTGTYDIKVHCFGELRKQIDNVPLFAGKAIKLNIELNDEIYHVQIIAYKVPLIQSSNPSCGSMRPFYFRKLPILSTSVSRTYSQPRELDLIKERLRKNR